MQILNRSGPLGFAKIDPADQSASGLPSEFEFYLRGTMFKTILFPVDSSRESRHAAEIVANIAKTYSSRLVTLSVYEPLEVGDVEPNAEQVSPEAIAQLLDEVKTFFAEQKVEAEPIEREGKPAFVICDVADEIDADLIIMGSRGMGLIEEGHDESVSNRVINLSPCPVLVVP